MLVIIMFVNNNFLENNYYVLYKIALAYELIEDELVDVNNIIDALCEADWALTKLYGCPVGYNGDI